MGSIHIPLIGSASNGTEAELKLGDAEGTTPDCLLVSDDDFWTSRDGCWALDAGLPLLVVNHGTAEEWGLANLAGYCRERWPDVPVHFLPQGSRVRTAVRLP